MADANYPKVTELTMHTALLGTRLPTRTDEPLDDAFRLAGVVDGAGFIGTGDPILDRAALRWLSIEAIGLNVGDRFAMVLDGEWTDTGGPIRGVFPDVLLCDFATVHALQGPDGRVGHWYTRPDPRAT